MNSFSDESFRKGHQTAVVISLCMISSVLFYAGIVEYLTRSNASFAGFAPLPPEIFNTLRLILIGVSVVDLAMIPYLRNRVLTAQNRAETPAAGRLLTALMLSFALCESIAIYGLILFLLNGARQEFYLFFFLSLIAFIIHFPRFERWQEWTHKIRDAVGQR